MAHTQKMSSSELSALWMTYQKKTMILRILEHLIETAEDKNAKKLMSSLWKELHPKVLEIKTLMQNEGAVVPVGFTEADVNLSAPRLFENGFDILLCRVLKEISLGLYTLHLTMSYRKDIVKLYQELTQITQKYYNNFTQYSFEKGHLPLPNYINMPKIIDFVTDKNYTKGFGLGGNKRPLNTIEFSYLFHSLQTNAVGLQLITGFAQCAQDKKVQKHMINGKDLCKNIIKKTDEVLIQNDVSSSSVSGASVTVSQASPFSEKLMMYCIYLLSNFGLGGQGFGAGFSMRDDINLIFGLYAKDTYQFIREGLKLMIERGWLEEPPKMDVNELD
ncbi:DUF3231 family protein [Cytobacillus purgationiresistens]|uniref:DUF3231 family protein n=1 Tax=Cytobacillus purgationiresistens TaxID=863449 RepID=A0ABU0AKJ7_9BACI|nr:DUF3231 family protein [Cytobacillus purgationiresistens]MDQ0270575.1 hypothetical protein [Cytobacillus purgationiresistens]